MANSCVTSVWFLYFHFWKITKMFKCSCQFQHHEGVCANTLCLRQLRPLHAPSIICHSLMNEYTGNSVVEDRGNADADVSLSSCREFGEEAPKRKCCSQHNGTDVSQKLFHHSSPFISSAPRNYFYLCKSGFYSSLWFCPEQVIIFFLATGICLCIIWMKPRVIVAIIHFKGLNILKGKIIRGLVF